MPQPLDSGHTKPFRVLVLFAAPNLFGMERAVIETFDLLRPEIEPHFLMSYATVRKNLPQLEEIEHRKLPHSFFSDTWDWKHITKPKSPKHIAEMVTALVLSNLDVLRNLHHVDAVYIPTIYQLYYALVASALFRLRGRKVVFEFHDVFLSPSASLRALQPYVSVFVNGSQFGADCTKQYASFIPADKLRLIPRTVDRPAPAHAPTPLSVFDGKRNIVFIGQLTPWKGLDLLAEAVAQVRSDYPDVLLHIVGSGRQPFEEGLRRRIDDLGVQDAVRFWGYRTDARVFLDGACIHVQPSRPSLFHESFGRVVVEAMSVGVPSIVFRSGGLQNSVVHGVTGLICDEESARSLADALTTLLEHPELRDRYGHAARQRYETELAPEMVKQQWLELFLDR
jgi:glycosyltransferase involved in cell wall biosynthesis